MPRRYRLRPVRLAATDETSAHAALRAMKTVAIADAEYSLLERRYVSAVGRWAFGLEVDPESLDSIEGGELGALVPVPQIRERVVAACLWTALFDGPTVSSEWRCLQGLGASLGFDATRLRQRLPAIDGQLALVRLDLLRRPAASAVPGLWEIRGFPLALDRLSAPANPEVSARYRRALELPSSTLGGAYARLLRGANLGFPGEVGAAPEDIVPHDCIHVLAELDASREDDVAAFTAGVQGLDPCRALLFVLARRELSRASAGACARMEEIDLDAVTVAFARGTHCRRDLTRGWDPTGDFGRPLVELRAELNVVPGTAT